MAARPITVLAVDDHPLMRDGIESLLAEAPDIALVGKASDGAEAVELFGTLRPDVTLMDIRMPGMGGLEALAAIRGIAPGALVIMLTVHRGEAQARRAIKAGAAGFLPKSMVRKALCDAIRIVVAGGKAIPAQMAVELANNRALDTLSEPEIEVLRLVAVGFSNKRIGAALDLPEETIKSRMRGILAKLSANDRTHAVMIAVRRGIIELY